MISDNCIRSFSIYVITATCLVLAGCATNPKNIRLPQSELVRHDYGKVPSNYKSIIHHRYFSSIHRLNYVGNIKFKLYDPEKCYALDDNGKHIYGKCVKVHYDPYNLFHMHLGSRTDTFFFYNGELERVTSGNDVLMVDEKSTWN